MKTKLKAPQRHSDSMQRIPEYAQRESTCSAASESWQQHRRLFLHRSTGSTARERQEGRTVRKGASKAFRERFKGVSLTNRKGTVLYQIDSACRFAQVSGAMTGTVPLTDLMTGSMASRQVGWCWPRLIERLRFCLEPKISHRRLELSQTLKAEKLPTISVDNLPDLFLSSDRFSMAVVVSFVNIQRSGGDRGMPRIF
jgi:hypothetical protein